MSNVTTEPEAISSAAATLSGIGDAMAADFASAAGPTTAVAAPAMDPVSAMTATHFSNQGQTFQAISAQASALHQQLVTTLNSNAVSYEQTETDNSLLTG